MQKEYIIITHTDLDETIAIFKSDILKVERLSGEPNPLTKLYLTGNRIYTTKYDSHFFTKDYSDDIVEKI